MQLLGFFPAVGAALPREHRTREAFGPRGCPGHAEAGVPVLQQRSSQRRTLEVEVREDEELIPEDVATVGLPVPTSSRYADIQVGGMRGNGLQQVEDVQVEDRFGPFVGAVHIDVEPVPSTAPGALVAAEQRRNVVGSGHNYVGIVTTLGDSAVAGGVKRGNFLHGYRLALLQLEPQIVGDEARLIDQGAVHLDSLAVTEHPGAGRESHTYS